MSKTTLVRYDKHTDATFREVEPGKWEMTSQGQRQTAVERYGRPLSVEELTALAPQPHTGPQTVIRYDSSAVDQAKAFSIRTWQFSFVAGLAGIAVSVFLVGNPFIAWLSFKWWLGWFCLTYLAMFAVDTLTSTQGQSFTHMLLGWIFIFREQNRRFRE